ncbi:MAG: DUF2064 domain-containing protein [Bacteroidota bacterium]
MTFLLRLRRLSSEKFLFLKANSTHTAILIFARTPEEEAKHKQWVAGSYEANIAFSRKLTEHTFKLSQRTELPIYLINSDEQRGDSFGDRFSHAIEEVFSYGFEHVVAVGNDTTGLQTQDLLNASKAVQNGKMVLGPSHDGGIYLLGISQSQYCRKAISSVRWESSLVWRDLQKFSKECHIPVSTLHLKADLDNSSDFKCFLRQGGNSLNLGQTLLKISLTHTYYDFDLPLLTLQRCVGQSSLRAPPMVA